ncbi:AcvB/VirJ family lysyl-phosphatidylglycerol hydrolase [Amaricoccus sp.]|uniref:virulence factor family protein n=1 Tax=Amaricoccus sp. TaxID=1872485 RepID=UPI001B78630D|nr:AcvB/VirJ family lysyl-phosphatidylglycerol hydrolase [Amaricoccus sp.]MBP7003386.1 virulence factor family protein [Amaricoccus sp.]
MTPTLRTPGTPSLPTRRRQPGPRSARPRRASLLLAACLALAAPVARADGPAAPEFDPGQIPSPTILTPDGPATGTVFLLSDAAGWGDAEAALAARLRHANAVVVGIDLPAYLAALDAEGKDCVYLVADFERMSHAIERSTGAQTFHAPIVAGLGEGAALAIDVLAQTPADTLGGVIAANPTAGQGLATTLCTKAAHTDADGGSSYALPAGAQPAPLTLILAADAPPAATARADALAAAGVTFERKTSPEPGPSALGDAIAGSIAAAAVAGDAPAIVELPATPSHDAMAIMLSGDGGWRDLDKTVAGLLQAQGVPTIGLDSLRWFWTLRTPEETGQELARLIDLYADRWGVSRVILAGYSFGASVLPAAIATMPPETQARVAEIALLAPGETADWEITVSGWLGSASSAATPIAADLAALPQERLLCVYGDKETDSACPALAGSGAALVETAGGHHFDGDYPALARHILDRLDPQEAAAPPAQ